jgi:Siphovirus ReqiPepy6 Gp37-like protein
MEVYVLDDQLRRVGTIIDTFQSLIWTERFRAFGDFQLDLLSTQENRSRFPTGTCLAMNESKRVMKVKTLTDKVDDDGNKIFSITGPSLEKILDDRVAKKTLSDTTTEPKWIITDQPADIARKLFHDICVTGVLDDGDVIPNITETTFMPASTIPEPTDTITAELDPQSLYAATKDLCDVWNLGFRLLRNGDSPTLYYDIYSGNDRTLGQSTLTPVVFSPGLDNLQNTSEFTSIDGAKNVAYVFSPAGFQVVYPDGVDPSVAGFERNVLVVNATDITTDDGNGGTRSPTDIANALIQRGKESLATNKGVSALDGEIRQDSQYKYGRDYIVGDLVVMQNSDGVANNMRVEEQIFVSDAQGERSYPTMTLDSLLTPNTWKSYLAQKVWADLTGQHWADV